MYHILALIIMIHIVGFGNAKWFWKLTVPKAVHYDNVKNSSPVQNKSAEVNEWNSLPPNNSDTGHHRLAQLIYVQNDRYKDNASSQLRFQDRRHSWNTFYNKIHDIDVKYTCRGSDDKFFERMNGGESVKIEDVPSQVSLNSIESKFSLCGGSIISKYWILTAASCVCKSDTKEKIDEDFFVASGFRCNQKGIFHEVDTVICHPRFKISYVNQGTNVIKVGEHDIALVKVKGSFKFGSARNRIRLNYRNEGLYGYNTTNFGWGAASVQVNHIAKFLLRTKMKIISKIQCDQRFAELNIHYGTIKGQLCLIPINKACYGEVGDPAIIDDSLVGIGGSIVTVNGADCDPNGLAIFADIRVFVRWIKTKIRQNANNRT